MAVDERVVGVEQVVGVERVVGIDLGTTNSLVAFMQGDTPVVIPGEDGDRLLPSVVAFPEGGGVLVGNAARGALLGTPERAVYSAKRLIGRGVAEVAEELELFPFRLEGGAGSREQGSGNGGQGAGNREQGAGVVEAEASAGERQVPFGNDNQRGEGEKQISYGDDSQRGEGEKQVPYGDDSKRGEGTDEKQVSFGNDKQKGGDKGDRGSFDFAQDDRQGGGGDVVRLRVGEKVLTPPEVSAYVLQQLKRNAERYFGAPVRRAVVTVPAYFNDAQRQATKDAGRIAGLEVLRLVNEPTAAALAYGLDKSTAESPNGEDRLIAVYDFGGGTFDVSILKLHEGIFEVVATGGDTHLGGDDIDNLLIAVAVEDIGGDLGVDVRGDAAVMQALRKAVIEAKIALSEGETARIVVEVPGKQVSFGDSNQKGGGEKQVPFGDDSQKGGGKRRSFDFAQDDNQEGNGKRRSFDFAQDDRVRGGAEDEKPRVYAREISRGQFEGLVAPVIERTAGPVRQALKDAGVGAEAIDEVVMVGGSTRIPAVRRLVAGLFGLEARGKTLHTELNPDEVVALGAAVQAQILSGQPAAGAAGSGSALEDLLLLDVTPLSLGIEALGGVVAKIIQRNSTIPASATEHFTTGVDGQTNVAIHVVQGERELAKDCRSLARFDLRGIPPMMAGLPRIEVRFLIDANGILKVSAREQRSGTEAEIDVKPTYGLTDEQVETMILDSFDNAEADFQERLVIEAKNEAETILAAVTKAKDQPTWQLLTGVEIAAIEQCEMEIKASIKGGDDKVIRRAIERLDASTRKLAELMMDNAVTGAMRGKSMATADQEMGKGPTAPHPFAKAEIEEAVSAKEAEDALQEGHKHSANETPGSKEG